MSWIEIHAVSCYRFLLWREKGEVERRGVHYVGRSRGDIYAKTCAVKGVPIPMLGKCICGMENEM